MQIFANAHTSGSLLCGIMMMGETLPPSFSQSFNLPKNIIWRQSVKTATTFKEGQKNYRIFNKQQQYQKIVEELASGWKKEDKKNV